jgi:glutamate:GABA antiporter
VTLGALWLVAGISIVGLRLGRWIQNAGALANWFPALAVIGLGAVALSLYGSANRIDLSTITPKLGDFSQLSYFAQLCFALAGLELLSFFQTDVDNPRRSIPSGILISGACVLGIYVLGTLGILVSVPQEQITLVNGLLLPLQHIGAKLNHPWIAGLSAILITVAGIGTTLAWFSGAARIPYLAGVDRYLPKSFGRLHPKLGTPVNAILVQTVAATLFTLFATVGSARLEAAYKILVDMCLILYFIPYCYLFLALPRLRRGATSPIRGAKVASYVGLGTTLIAIATTLLPTPTGVDWVALGKTAIGTAVMLAVGGGLFAAASMKSRTPRLEH